MIKERIESNLKKAFDPTLIEVIDQSHLHMGHAGYKPGEQTHFSVTIVSDRFNGLTRLERHRLVYEALESELNEGIHALQLKLVSAEESGELA